MEQEGDEGERAGRGDEGGGQAGQGGEEVRCARLLVGEVLVCFYRSIESVLSVPYS